MSTPLEKSYVLHVNRGNQGVVFPIGEGAANDVDVRFLAGMIARTFASEQAANPGRASHPIDANDTPLALRLHGRDEALIPTMAL